MNFELVTVSKYASEIIDRNVLQFFCLQNLIYYDVLLKIHMIYPTLYKEGDPILYWQYSKDVFLRIENYFTFFQMLQSMADRNVYLLLQDCEPNGEETESFLRWLDYLEERNKEKRARTKYDLFLHKCKRKKRPSFDYVPRTDQEILSFALRNIPNAKCYTADLLLHTKTAEFIRRGIPKRLKLKKVYRDEVIERILPKASKKDKKGKKDGKNKKNKKNKK